MLYRKFTSRIEEFLQKEPQKIMLVNGANQSDKTAGGADLVIPEIKLL
ncbi:MAG: hypothetical protein IK144_11580 [Bacteroidaceae bacterium]|nr:hypothetical protein [Bacteroidaceae bacterium]